MSGEQRRRRRSGSRVARSFAGAEWGVIERSPGSLETHFPFPQNERSGRPTGQVQGKRGKLEARRGADDADGDDCVVGGGAAAVQTRSESRKNQEEDEGMCNHNQGERRTERRLACDCEGPIKSNCLNAIFISMAIEFLHNLAKQRLRPPARALPFRGTAPCARVRRIRELELSRWFLLQNDGLQPDDLTPRCVRPANAFETSISEQRVKYGRRKGRSRKRRQDETGL